MAYSKQREKSIQTFQNKIYNYEFMYGLVLFNISMISLSYIEKTSFKNNNSFHFYRISFQK